MSNKYRALLLQANLHDHAKKDAKVIMIAFGKEIIEPKPQQRQLFIAAAAPIYEQAQRTYSSELLSLINL